MGSWSGQRRRRLCPVAGEHIHPVAESGALQCRPVRQGRGSRQDTVPLRRWVGLSGPVSRHGRRAGNLDKCRYLFARSIALVAVYATPFYVGLVWLASHWCAASMAQRGSTPRARSWCSASPGHSGCYGDLSGAVVAARDRLGDELRIQVATTIATVLAVVISLPHGIDGVAWAMVGCRWVHSLFMYPAGYRDASARVARPTLQALGPALLLNGILAIALYLTERALPAGCSTMTCCTSRAWALSAAWSMLLAPMPVPVPALATQRARWRSQLRLPGAKRQPHGPRDACALLRSDRLFKANAHA